nr:MAG TPA_asm: hypothetical protein [Bacteriophage sp.]DAO61403.1 MAG TPA: hypothetical protein [Caudoviricetes sp.]
MFFRKTDVNRKKWNIYRHGRNISPCPGGTGAISHRKRENRRKTSCTKTE